MPRSEDPMSPELLIALQIMQAGMPLFVELMTGARSQITKQDVLDRCEARMDAVDARMLERIQEAEDAGVDSGD